MSDGKPWSAPEESESTQPDIVLVIKVRDGDPVAMAELWHQHFPSACAAARRITGCPDPGDAASEAFLATVRAIRSGHGPVTGSFRAYLCSVATRLAVRDAVRRSVLDGWEREDHHAAGDDVEDVSFVPTETDPGVIGWDQLPERWRRVLWLTVVERRTPADVAEKAGMTPNAVAALAYRARSRLRDLQPQANDLDQRQRAVPRAG